MTNRSQQPRVSLITVNYNGAAVTSQFIESVLSHPCAPELEIVVVDNGSREDEARLLAGRYADVKVIRSDRNLGFAGGNNLGTAHASGRYLFYVNNDTEFGAGSLDALLDYMDSHPDVGVLTPKLVFFHTGKIQFAGFTPLSKITLRNSITGFNEADAGQYDSPSETPYAHGAAMLVRREVLDTAGPMPEMYFLYYEELDWCNRIREAGWRIMYVPLLTVLHKESATTGRVSSLKLYYMTRNRLLFASRNIRGAGRYLSYAYQYAFVIPKHVVLECMHGRFSNIPAIFAGARDFTKMNRNR